MTIPFHVSRVTLIRVGFFRSNGHIPTPAKHAACQMSCCQVINLEGLIQRNKRLCSQATICNFINSFIATLQSSFISQTAPSALSNLRDGSKSPWLHKCSILTSGGSGQHQHSLLDLTKHQGFARKMPHLLAQENKPQATIWSDKKKKGVGVGGGRAGLMYLSVTMWIRN